ncbi:MAG: hypothetical protein JWN44_4556 [Myxococcales bacterium]|nr:hypothetical protein [Myxococcales bacterium]
MPALTFTVTGARVEPHAALPTVVLALAIDERQGLAVEGVALQCQLNLEPQRRRYSPAEEERLVDLFGAPRRWSSTVRPLPWIDTSLFVPPFSGQTEVELSIPCSYDLEVSAAKYFHALDDGDVPVRLLFRGTIFARGERGIEMTPMPWDREAAWRLPVRLWREAIDGHFPNAGWLRLRKQTIDALMAFKGRHALASWDGVIETLLSEVER